MRLLFLALLMSASTMLTAQTMGTMPFSTPQLSNPAFIALNNQPQLNVYGKLGSRFGSSYVGYNQYSPKLKGTWGVFHNSFVARLSDDYRFNKNNMGVSYARLFNINDKWKYSLGAGLQVGGLDRNFPNESSFDFAVDFNVGGVLYANNFFTAINYSPSLIGNANHFAWRTGYKVRPFNNKDFSITPIITFTNFGSGNINTEYNINLAYKNLSLNFGYNLGGFNMGVAYEFKRFSLFYTFGNMYSINSRDFYGEGGIRFNLSKKNKGGKNANFNHRLF